MEQVFTEEELPQVAAAFWKQYGHYQIFALYGDMGAGKTTFVHAICDQIGVKDPVSSPTFSIINQYKTSRGFDLYHMDLYRLKDEEEVIQAGVEEALYSKAVCFIEWPQKAANFLPVNTVSVTLEAVSAKERRLLIRIPQ